MSTPPTGGNDHSTDPDAVVERNRADRGESSLLAGGDGRHWAGWLGVAILVVTFSLAGGLDGALAGGFAAAVWFALGTPAAIATGTVLVTVATAGGIEPVTGALFVGGLLALLVVPTVATGPRGSSLAAVVLATAVFGGPALLLARTQSLWLVATVLVGTGAVVVSGLSRYQRLRLGLLGDDTDRPSEPRADDESASSVDATTTIGGRTR